MIILAKKICVLSLFAPVPNPPLNIDQSLTTPIVIWSISQGIYKDFINLSRESLNYEALIPIPPYIGDSTVPIFVMGYSKEINGELYTKLINIALPVI